MNTKVKTYIALHIILFIYSFSGVCTKMASKQDFLSLKFCIFYGLMICLLFGYAIVWQQIIKRIPLTGAYASKAVTIVWGIVWGALIFKEWNDASLAKIFGELIGAAFVIAGVILFSFADNKIGGNNEKE